MPGNLDRFPLAPLHRVFHLVARVEPREWREGVDPGAAWAWEGAHEAGDAAQGGDGLWRQRCVHQQVWHQVPSLIDDWQVHAVASRRSLKSRAQSHSQQAASARSEFIFAAFSSSFLSCLLRIKKQVKSDILYILFFNATVGTLGHRGLGQPILARLICVIETQGGSSGEAFFFITVTVISWHVLCFPDSKKLFWSLLVSWPVNQSKHWDRTLHQVNKNPKLSVLSPPHTF